MSDIHILPKRDRYIVYFRINGDLIEQTSHPAKWGNKLIAYFKYLADMDVGEKRVPQSGAATLKIGQEWVETRFSTITNYQLKESIVIRILRQDKHHGDRGEVFFPQDYEVLRELIQRKSGLILFSGPVGSGKTTTIYQLLQERMHSQAVQVITMEDPVEIYEPDFLQLQVNERAGITYDVLIKATLRHHPDILMIGEIRDEETARMVIRGALTGHLMIATIHAKNSLGVIGRLQELRISQEQLKQTIIGIISQRLVPKYCPCCGGACQMDCDFYPPHRKRAALFEILQGSALEAALSGQTFNMATLNHQLNKGWLYGYIDQQSLRHFELV